MGSAGRKSVHAPRAAKSGVVTTNTYLEIIKEDYRIG
jgi:hypothetical protein